MNTISEIYDFLDKTGANFKYTSVLTDPIKIIRDKLLKEKVEDEAQICQWELDFISFIINDNVLSPIFSTTNDVGEIYKYPDLKNFTDSTYDYLEKRREEVNSIFLKKHYSHLLWLSPRKNIKYAKKAIESYSELIPIYEELDKEYPKDHYGLKIRQCLRNLLILSTSIKYKTDEVKELVIKIVNEFNKASSSTYVMRLDLIELMLTNKKLFDKEDFIGLDILCKNFAQELEASNPHLSIDLYNLIIKINTKIRKENAPYYLKIAEIYEKMSVDREDDTNLASIAFCQEALSRYKELKNIAKVEELTQRYKELKKNMKLDEIGKTFDYTEVFKTLKDEANKITENNTSDIISALMNDVNIIPDLDYLKQQADENKKTFLYVVPAQILDRNGHISQHFVDEEERYEHEIFNSMNYSLQLMRNHFIREILFQAVKKHKLTAYDILLYLNQHSWYGKNIEKKEPGTGKIYEYNWLNLIAPSLYEYFKQIEQIFIDYKFYPNLVLAIDSLALKFEGLIRDLCEFLGVATFFFTKDNKGRDIAREKDINVLFREQVLKDTLIPEDLFFLKFILVEKAGYNLRNNIAHSLMKYEGYTIEYMHLLIIGLLKLGKYDFVKEPKLDEVSNSSSIETS